MRGKNDIGRAATGDRRAGERLVTAHYATVYRLLRHLTGDRQAAEDLTQQTFVCAWEALAAFRGECEPRTWLQTIAYHEYVRWLRAHKPTASLEEAADLPDLSAAAGLDTLLLQRALRQLGAEQRDAFLLFHVQQLSLREVGKILEVPVGTVKSRLFAARQRLRELMREADPPERAPVRPVSPPSEERIIHELSTSR